MSDRLDKVERLRQALGGGGERLIEVVELFAVPELRSRLAGGALSTDYVGIEPLRRGWADFLAAFDRVRIEFSELTEIGDIVVDMVTVVGFPKGTDTELQQPGAGLWEFDGDRLVRVEFHLDRGEALRRAHEIAAEDGRGGAASL